MFLVYQDAEPGAASHFRRAKSKMVREIRPESLAVPAMPPASETGCPFQQRCHEYHAPDGAAGIREGTYSGRVYEHLREELFVGNASLWGIT